MRTLMGSYASGITNVSSARMRFRRIVELLMTVPFGCSTCVRTTAKRAAAFSSTRQPQTHMLRSGARRRKMRSLLHLVAASSWFACVVALAGCGSDSSSGGGNLGSAGASGVGIGNGLGGGDEAESGGGGDPGAGGTVALGGSAGAPAGGAAGEGGASSLDGAVCVAPDGPFCMMMPPECATGEVPSVVGMCWGECVPIGDCACEGPEDCPEPGQYTCHNYIGRCGPFV